MVNLQEISGLTVREFLFRDMLGCTNHDCVITDRTNKLGTNSFCSCLENMNRSQLTIISSQLKTIANYTLEKR